MEFVNTSKGRINLSSIRGQFTKARNKLRRDYEAFVADESHHTLPLQIAALKKFRRDDRRLSEQAAAFRKR